MTVRELFEKVEFDALVPTLDKLAAYLLWSLTFYGFSAA